jgi:cellobiose phosphorylase
MSYGTFKDGGKQYVIPTSKTPANWYNYLFNDSYYMEVSQTGQGKSIAFHPGYRQFNGQGYRHFYLLDHETGECWCPAVQPLGSQAEGYTCTHSLGWSEIRSVHHGISTVIRVFVPRDGMREIWSVTVSNKSAVKRSLSLYSAYSIENGGVMGSICQFDEAAQALTSFSFPYHVFYEDKEKCDEHSNLVYLFSNRRADSYDCSEQRFFGGDDTRGLPLAVRNGQCSEMRAEAENPVGAFQHRLVLEPGHSDRVDLVFGCARTPEEIQAIRETFLKQGAEELLREVNGYWDALSDVFTVDTPDEHLNDFMNHWLKKQIVLQTRTNRMSNYCPIRNQLQDALGYAMLDPEGALNYMVSVLERQETSGFIQQWIMTDGSPPSKLCLLTHKDGPVWLLICLIAIVHQAGDPAILDLQVGFKNLQKSASIYEHLLLAVFYMAEDTGSHGLCLMGHGDWNDPINGPGRLGRGESAWSTMALKYGILQLLPLCRLRADEENNKRLKAISNRLDQAINNSCWDGAWYVAGFDDAGEAFGTDADEEGKLFLNTQTWAIMCEAARGTRLQLCLDAIDRLDTPAGPLLLEPAFTQWNPKWGRISVKLAGTTENGSVYCHASMFKAFADCRAGRGTLAYETIAKTLPTNPDNPPERNLQVPIFLPNFYFGLRNSPNFGRSSHHNSTGTVGWMLWTVMDYVLGIRATAGGLEIDPCIPAAWKGYSVARNFRKARYQIRVLNPQGLEQGKVSLTVDGVLWNGPLLPYEAGRTFMIEAVIG